MEPFWSSDCRCLSLQVGDHTVRDTYDGPLRMDVDAEEQINRVYRRAPLTAEWVVQINQQPASANLQDGLLNLQPPRRIWTRSKELLFNVRVV